MTDEEILGAASVILATRQKEAAAVTAAEIQRLYKQYANKRGAAPHDLGKPQKLAPEEALLLFALERNKYVVEAECPNKRETGRWHGSALCKYNVRAGAITMRADSRHDALLSLWATVSDQEGTDRIVLTEEHLQGALVQRHLRELHQELKAQERGKTGAEEDDE